MTSLISCSPDCSSLPLSCNFRIPLQFIHQKQNKYQTSNQVYLLTQHHSKQTKQLNSKMSFLTRTTLRVAPSSSILARRAFSTSFISRKSATETVKDAAKTVDKKVSSKIVDGIEASETVAKKAKEVGGMSAGEVKGKASEVAGEAKGKSSELAGKAKGAKEEVKGKL